MALIAAHLNAAVILVVTVYRLVYSLPLLPPPYPLPPLSPSLISLMVSVDVKHLVYLLYSLILLLLLRTLPDLVTSLKGLSISAQLSTDAVSALRKVWVPIRLWFGSVVLLNVLGCRLAYKGQAETNAEAWFSNSLRQRKPEGSLGRTAQDGHLNSHTAPELRLWKQPSAQVANLLPFEHQ